MTFTMENTFKINKEGQVIKILVCTMYTDIELRVAPSIRVAKNSNKLSTTKLPLLLNTGDTVTIEGENGKYTMKNDKGRLVST